MKIEFKGKTISNISDWEKEIFFGKKKKHWKVGRSAYEIANFIINNNGELFIKNEVSKIIGEKLTLELAHPECEVRFDKYGHGREHDLGIFGKTASGKSIFIGIEAKVDETFGDKISDAYLKAKVKELNGNKTNSPRRIEELLCRNFESVKKSNFDLRYQLLYSTVGTTSVKADMHIFFILVFKTSSSEIDKIKSNKIDYIKFFKGLKAKSIPKTDDFEAIIDGIKLIAAYREFKL